MVTPNVLEPLRGLLVPIADLVLDPANARKHPERNVETIKASLARFGQRKPVVVQRQGMVVRAGNGLVQAAKVLGWDAVAAVVVEESAVEAAAYAIADNRTGELSAWDDAALDAQLAALRKEGVDLGELGWNEEEIEEVSERLEPEKDVVEDDVPEVAEETVSAAGELWLCGEHRVLCGDATKAEDVARIMAGKKADCVFTSPPYAVGIDYGEYEDTIENLRAMLPVLAEQWLSVVEDGGFAVVNFGDIASGRNVAETDGPCE